MIKGPRFENESIICSNIFKNSVKLGPNISILYAHKSRIIINDSHACFCHNSVPNEHTLKTHFQKVVGGLKQLFCGHSSRMKVTSN